MCSEILHAYHTISLSMQQFKNMKFIDVSGCKSLVCTPDFSCAPNLETLKLSYCKNLVEVHQSVGYLSKLTVLLLDHCSKLTLFPDQLKSKSLTLFSLSGCSKLETFPEIPEQMDRLQYLYLCSTAIKELPASIENIVSLKYLDLRFCSNLTTLPPSVYNLQRLKYLSLEDCSKFTEFPRQMDDSTDSRGSLGFRALEHLDLRNCNLSEVEFLDSPSCFTALRWLYLSGNNINSLPLSINRLQNLEDLQVEKCEQLRETPDLPLTVTTLKGGNYKLLRKIPNLSSQASDFLRVEFSSCPELVREGLNVSDILSLQVTLSLFLPLSLSLSLSFSLSNRHVHSEAQCDC